MNQLALQKSIQDVIAEYDAKNAALSEAISAFGKAGDALKTASTVGGTWGNVSIDTGSVSEWKLKDGLLKSAWRHVYEGLNIQTIASAKDKNKWLQSLEKPAPFTLDNVRATFGDYLPPLAITL